jgi:hypothetical protein
MGLEMDSRKIGYGLLTIAAALITISWLISYPLALPTRGGYLFDSIYPSFWIGLSLADISLFLIARKAASSWERFACAAIFVLLMFSILYFFTFLGGPDSNTFRGLTENYASTGTLLQQKHDYYQWPGLFVLGTAVAQLMAISVSAASELLFAVWSLVLAGGIFLYTTRQNNIEDFLSVVIYLIAAYPFFNWQYAAQSFALTLFTVCIILITRTDSASRALTVLVYIVLVLSHAFFAVFLVVAAFVLVLRDRRSATFAILLGLFYVSYVVLQSTLFFRDTVALISVALLAEYSSVVAGVLTQPASALDAFAQLVSRSATISIWLVAGTITLYSLLSKRLRDIDISLGVSGVSYGLAGVAASVLGWRAIQIAVFPATHAMKAFSTRNWIKRILLAYFLIILVIFPLVLVHYYYDDTNYLTLREEHAVNVVFVAAAEHGGQTSIRVLTRNMVRGFVESKTATDTYYITEGNSPEYLKSAVWFHMVFASPELWYDLSKYAGVTSDELVTLKANTTSFSRVYSNGQVTILFNSNATELPRVNP